MAVAESGASGRAPVTTTTTELQRLNSSRKKWGGCHPDPAGAGEASAFRANVKEEADPSGKRRLRDDNLSVFPQTVKPLGFGPVYVVAIRSCRWQALRLN